MIDWSDPNGADEIRAAEELNVEQLPGGNVCPEVWWKRGLREGVVS